MTTTTTKQLLTEQMQAQADQFQDIEDAQDPCETLWEVPLEVRVEQQLTVVLCTGGPYVEARATIRDGQIIDAQLEGWWASNHESWAISPNWPIWDALEQYAEALS